MEEQVCEHSTTIANKCKRKNCWLQKSPPLDGGLASSAKQILMTFVYLLGGIHIRHLDTNPS
jgi:hypothetical protein